jgi:Metal-dependent hydrolases of the beta-lactamase superfamily I
MIKFHSLFSGSSGNSLLIQTDNTSILIDAGVSCKKLVSSLQDLNISIEKIDAIFVTHEHSDHVKSVGTISKTYDIPVFASKKTWEAMEEQKNKISYSNQKAFNICEEFNLNDIKILPFHTPHDAVEPCGFNFFCENKKITIATDLGHMNNNLLKNLEGSDFMLLESNYDPEILKFSRYPSFLKQRIKSNLGHLSNYAAGETIVNLIPSGVKNVMLGHMSKENNFPELAYETVLEQLRNSNCKLDNLTIAYANNCSDIVIN